MPPNAQPNGGGSYCYGGATSAVAQAACDTGPNSCAPGNLPGNTPCAIDAKHCATGIAGSWPGFDLFCPLDVPLRAAPNAAGQWCYASALDCFNGRARSSCGSLPERLAASAAASESLACLTSAPRHRRAEWLQQQPTLPDEPRVRDRPGVPHSHPLVLPHLHARRRGSGASGAAVLELGGCLRVGAQRLRRAAEHILIRSCAASSMRAEPGLRGGGKRPLVLPLGSLTWGVSQPCDGPGVPCGSRCFGLSQGSSLPAGTLENDPWEVIKQGSAMPLTPTPPFALAVCSTRCATTARRTAALGSTPAEGRGPAQRVCSHRASVEARGCMPAQRMCSTGAVMPAQRLSWGSQHPRAALLHAPARLRPSRVHFC